MEEAEVLEAVQAIVNEPTPPAQESQQEDENDRQEEKIEQEEEEFVEKQDQEQPEQKPLEQEEKVSEKKVSQKVVPPRESTIIVSHHHDETSTTPATLVQDAAKQCLEVRASFQQSNVLPDAMQTIDNTSHIYASLMPSKKPKEKPTKKPIQNHTESLQQNKLIKQIFTHFCKENYISSIKSTLFEDKQKVMEEMSLNKWMVFCKEFDIFTQLCSFKLHQRKKITQETHQMQSSQVREQIRVKQVKEVQKSLSNIFKKATENHTKMQYQHFAAAVKLLKEEFNHQNSQLSLENDLDFAKKYLHCESDHQCLKKLSNLKFTFGIPQIEYMKLPAFQGTDKSKSRYKLTETKQNCNQTDISKKPKNISSNESRAMLLNPIIKQAKNVLSTPQNKASLASMRKQGSKMKLSPGQPKRDKHSKHQTHKDPLHSDLLKYFDQSKDEILQSYFKVQKLSSAQK